MIREESHPKKVTVHSRYVHIISSITYVFVLLKKKKKSEIDGKKCQKIREDVILAYSARKNIND
jgi:hypothetical protein